MRSFDYIAHTKLFSISEMNLDIKNTCEDKPERAAKLNSFPLSFEYQKMPTFYMKKHLHIQ